VGELGYEVDYLWDAVAFPTVNNSDYFGASALDRNTASFVLRCENIGFSGLFFAGRLLFWIGY
jgi:hypothetical protein